MARCVARPDPRERPRLTTFKEKVWNNFYNRLNKKYRSPEPLYSKWRSANRAKMEFNDIYMNAMKTPQSGATEVDVMAKVRKIYKEKVGKPFVNESF